MDNSTKRYVVLEGIEHGNRFYTTNVSSDDPTKSATGETWYKVLGYADTSEEAEHILYPNPGDKHAALCQYMREQQTRMCELVEQAAMKA